MKKIISLTFLIALLCAIFSGCTGTGNGTTSNNNSTESTKNTTISDTSDKPIIPSDSSSSSEIISGNPNPDDTTNAGPVASSSTFSTTLPIFARLDFGTRTYAADQKMTTHEYITSAITYNKDFVGIEFTEDSLKISAKKDGTFTAAGDTADLTDSQYFLRGTNTCYYSMNDFAICFDDLVTYDFDDELRSGYGTWANLPFNFSNIGNATDWRGYHQYMKIRILNPTSNDKIAVQFNNSVDYASTQFMVMSIGKEKKNYETYTYDLCYAATYASGKGVLLAGQNPGNNWTWKQNTQVTGLRFHLLGSTCSYANAYLNNKFGEGESAADYDVYKEYFNRLDSRSLIKAGDTVEIDYIIFGSTPGQLAGYQSYIESSSAAAKK